MRSSLRSHRLGPVAILLGSCLGALASTGCTDFDAPPTAIVAGASEGFLDDAHAPIVIAFSKPVDPATVHLKIARFVVDVEGNLGDEDTDDATDIDVLFDHEGPGDDSKGTAEIASDGLSMTITPSAAMPVGPPLVVLVEPGLASPKGLPTTVRRRIAFAYRFKLDCNAPVTAFESGAYFLLADVKKPISTQVQLLARIELDSTTGTLVGAFTNADRNKDASRCPGLSCSSAEVCRTLPMPACVAPSERAGTVDEYPDYVANTTPPTGFVFQVQGCAKDEAETSTFSTAPVDVIVQAPPVTLRNTVLTATFSRDAQGALRGSGSLVADDVLLGTSSSGRGEGVISAVRIPDDQVPPGIPDVQKKSSP